jgi:hypothetical protein
MQVGLLLSHVVLLFMPPRHARHPATPAADVIRGDTCPLFSPQTTQLRPVQPHHTHLCGCYVALLGLLARLPLGVGIEHRHRHLHLVCCAGGWRDSPLPAPLSMLVLLVRCKQQDVAGCACVALPIRQSSTQTRGGRDLAAQHCCGKLERGAEVRDVFLYPAVNACR